MKTVANDDQIAKMRAEELISDIPLMAGVNSIKVEPYIDNTGDPSLQLTFSLDRNVLVDDNFVDRFLEFSGVVQTRILHSELNRFPYTRMEQAA